LTDCGTSTRAVQYSQRPARKRALVGLDADVRRLLQLYNVQIKVYRKAQTSLLRRLERQGNNPEWVMPATVREELEVIDAFLSRATKSMLELKAATAEANAALDTEALTAQLKEEFMRSMKTWDDEDWSVVERFRLERAAFRPQSRRELGPAS